MKNAQGKPAHAFMDGKEIAVFFEGASLTSGIDSFEMADSVAQMMNFAYLEGWRDGAMRAQTHGVIDSLQVCDAMTITFDDDECAP